MFNLIQLPYSIEALEPVISARTLEFHHGKHLKGYVDNLNKLIAGTPFEEMPLKEIVLKSDGAIFNNAGQILNHNMYFEQFASVPEPVEGSLKQQIKKQWGTLEAFRSLVITQEPGASNPVVKGLKPLLTFDVWEHAYYLDYQNRRADHLSSLWQIVSWRVVETRY